MNDDQYSERELLAVNACLDGEATADERALVESSSELTAMLEQWRDVRDQTTGVQVPAASREAALAAAMTAFDELGHPVTATPDNVSHLDRRRRQYRYIAGAAAAVAVVFGGLILLQSGGGSDDDGVTAVELAPKEPGSVQAAAPQIAIEAAPTDEAASQLAPAAGDVSSEAAATDGGAAPAATAPTAEAPAPGVVASSEPATLPVIDSPEALTAYYAASRSVTTTAAADSAPSTTRALCPAGRDLLIGPVVYQGVTALVVISNDGTELRALDASTCTVLVTTTP